MNRKKIGLALGSGGVRGLVHAGVIKTLVKHGIPIDYMAGSSIGSWVGAYYGLYQDVDRLEEFIVGKRKEKLKSFFEPTIASGLVKGEKLQKLLDEWFDGADFKNLKIPLTVVTTDLLSGRQVDFNSGNLAFAVRASMAVPGLFRPVAFDNKILVDGGISNPVPDDVVRAMGADIVISVNLDFRRDFKPSKPRLDLTGVTIRTMEIMRQKLAEYSLRSSDVVIEPDLTDYSSWAKYFFNHSGNDIVKVGEIETEKIIPRLKELLNK